MDKLQELKQNWAKIDEKFKEIRAMGTDPKSNEIMDYVWDAMSSIRNQMWDLHDSHASQLNNHINPQKGIHPPTLNSASAVQNYLDACGMSEDFEIQKPVINVKANTSGRKNFDIDLKLEK